MAGKTHVAFATKRGSVSILSWPNWRCWGEAIRLDHVAILDVAQQVVRLDEVVAGIEVTVVLQRKSVAAGGRMDAQAVLANVRAQRHVEHLHVDSSHIARRTHSSKTPVRKRPNCSGWIERSVTTVPVWV